MLSIITPVLNGAAFIEDNIKSVQSLSIEYEHIVVDGHSTDNTLAILAKYPDIKVVMQSNTTGMYGAIHEGITTAQGDFICYLNCDDRLLTAGFEKLYQLAVSSDADLTYGDGVFFYAASQQYKYIAAKPCAAYWLRHGELPFCQPSSIFKKGAYEKAGGLRYETYKIIGDFDLFRRITALPNVRVKRLNVLATVFLKHGASLGDLNTERYLQEKQTIMALTKTSSGIRWAFRLVNFVANQFWGNMNRKAIS